MSQDKHANAAETSTPQAETQPVAAKAAAAAVEKKRLLVVDDEPLVARSVVRMLSSEHLVEVASSVGQARERLGAAPAFDAVLCDLMMPDGTGMDLFAWLDQSQPALAGRVVFMTGGAFTSAAADFLSRVPNKRLEKPFTPKALREAVRAALE